MGGNHSELKAQAQTTMKFALVVCFASVMAFVSSAPQADWTRRFLQQQFKELGIDRADLIDLPRGFTLPPRPTPSGRYDDKKDVNARRGAGQQGRKKRSADAEPRRDIGSRGSGQTRGGQGQTGGGGYGGYWG